MSDWPSTTPKVFAYWGIFCLFLASGGMATMAITNNMDLIKTRTGPLPKGGPGGFLMRAIGLIVAIAFALLGIVALIIL